MYQLHLGNRLMGPSEDREKVMIKTYRLGYPNFVDLCTMHLIPEEGNPFKARTKLHANGTGRSLAALVRHLDWKGNITYSLHECTRDLQQR